jgi:hypothetical protein
MDALFDFFFPILSGLLFFVGAGTLLTGLAAAFTRPRRPRPDVEVGLRILLRETAIYPRSDWPVAAGALGGVMGGLVLPETANGVPTAIAAAYAVLFGVIGAPRTDAFNVRSTPQKPTVIGRAICLLLWFGGFAAALVDAATTAPNTGLVAAWMAGLCSLVVTFIFWVVLSRGGAPDRVLSEVAGRARCYRWQPSRNQIDLRFDVGVWRDQGPTVNINVAKDTGVVGGRASDIATAILRNATGRSDLTGPAVTAFAEEVVKPRGVNAGWTIHSVQVERWMRHHLKGVSGAALGEPPLEPAAWHRAPAGRLFREAWRRLWRRPEPTWARTPC